MGTRLPRTSASPPTGLLGVWRMAKISKPVLYLAIVAAGAAIYVLTSPNPTVAHTPKPTLRAKNNLDNGQFTDEDYKAKFAEPVLVSRDGFKHLVVRRSNV